MPHFVDDDLTLVLVNVGENTVGSPVEFAVGLAVPRRVVPLGRRPELISSDAVKFLLDLGSSLAIQRLERSFGTGREGNGVGHW